MRPCIWATVPAAIALGLSACPGAKPAPSEPRPSLAVVQVPSATAEDDAATPEAELVVEEDAGATNVADAHALNEQLDLHDAATGFGGIGIIGIADGGFTGGIGFGSGRSRAGGNLQFGQSSVKGPLDANIIRRFVRRSAMKIRYCYEKELLKDPKLTAKISPRFVIAADGSVSQVTLPQSSGNAALDACVIQTFRQLQFPKPKGGVVIVTYPLIFKSAP